MIETIMMIMIERLHHVRYDELLDEQEVEKEIHAKCQKSKYLTTKASIAKKTEIWPGLTAN